MTPFHQMDLCCRASSLDGLVRRERLIDSSCWYSVMDILSLDATANDLFELLKQIPATSPANPCLSRVKAHFGIDVARQRIHARRMPEVGS